MENEKHHHFYCKKFGHFCTGKFQSNYAGLQPLICLYVLIMNPELENTRLNIYKENDILVLPLWPNLSDSSMDQQQSIPSNSNENRNRNTLENNNNKNASSTATREKNKD